MEEKKHRFAGQLARLAHRMRSIRAQMVLFYGLSILLPMLLMMLVINRITVRIMQDEIQTYVSETVNQVSLRLEDSVTAFTTLPKRLCADETVERLLKKEVPSSPAESMADQQKMARLIDGYEKQACLYVFGDLFALHRTVRVRCGAHRRQQIRTDL